MGNSKAAPSTPPGIAPMEPGAPAENPEVAVASLDIWSLILKDKNPAGKSANSAKRGNEATAIFCGGKGSGKSTLIDKFTNPESTKANKPTAALEYKSARKDMKNGEHKLVHLWELGGGSQLCSLLECALKKETFSGTVCIVVVDLSKPEEIVSIAQFWFQRFRERAQQVLSELQSMGEDSETLNLGRENGSAECCGLPVYLLAHKCAGIREAEPVLQKTVAKTLRSLALEMGATLLYTDSYEKVTIQVFRKLLNHDVFGTEPMQVLTTDYKKRPLAITVGCDTAEKISGEDSGGTNPTVDAWGQKLKDISGSKSIDEIDGKASVLELAQYEEANVNAAREQKDQELVQYRKKCEREAGEALALLGKRREEDQQGKKVKQGRRRSAEKQ